MASTLPRTDKLRKGQRARMGGGFGWGGEDAYCITPAPPRTPPPLPPPPAAAAAASGGAAPGGAAGGAAGAAARGHRLLGVADGVGSWGEQGIDAGKYARALVQVASRPVTARPVTARARSLRLTGSPWAPGPILPTLSPARTLPLAPTRTRPRTVQASLEHFEAVVAARTPATHSGSSSGSSSGGGGGGSSGGGGGGGGALVHSLQLSAVAELVARASKDACATGVQGSSTLCLVHVGARARHAAAANCHQPPPTAVVTHARLPSQLLAQHLPPPAATCACDCPRLLPPYNQPPPTAPNRRQPPPTAANRRQPPQTARPRA
jgi:hypothetical protein